LKGEAKVERKREQGTIETFNSTPEERLKAIFRVIERGQYEKIDGTMIDLSTAGAIKAVYEALSPENKDKFTTFPAGKMGLIAWKLVR
jgi:hypothetical protein